MSGIRIQCKSCGKQSAVRAQLAGKRVKCPECGEAVAVPLAAPASPARSNKPTKQRKQRPAAYWTFRWGDITDIKKKDAFIALEDDAFWTMPLEGKAAKRAAADMDDGVPPGEALGSGASRVPYSDIIEVRYDANRSNLIVDRREGDGLMTHDFAFADADSRGEVYEEFERRLEGWDSTKEKFSPVRAAVAPLISMATIAGFTILAVVLAILFQDWQVENNFIGMIRFLGPIGWAAFGGAVIASLGVWMLIRMMKPPVMHYLRPAADEAE